MTKEMIVESCKKIRSLNIIPEEVLDYMRDASIMQLWETPLKDEPFQDRLIELFPPSRINDDKDK